MGDDPLIAALLEQLHVMPAGERESFGSLEPKLRDRPMRPNDWSPKDHQAHLTAWKGPDLAEFAREDPDLVELRDELLSLAEGAEPTR